MSFIFFVCTFTSRKLDLFLLLPSSEPLRGLIATLPRINFCAIDQQVGCSAWIISRFKCCSGGGRADAGRSGAEGYDPVTSQKMCVIICP